MSDLGYRRPSSKPAVARLRTFAEVINTKTSALCGKRLADGLSEQMTVVSEALGAPSGVEVPNYFGRQNRDENAEGGAWAITS